MTLLVNGLHPTIKSLVSCQRHSHARMRFLERVQFAQPEQEGMRARGKNQSGTALADHRGVREPWNSVSALGEQTHGTAHGSANGLGRFISDLNWTKQRAGLIYLYYRDEPLPANELPTRAPRNSPKRFRLGKASRAPFDSQ